jgi:hypothetical protein
LIICKSDSSSIEAHCCRRNQFDKKVKKKSKNKNKNKENRKDGEEEEELLLSEKKKPQSGENNMV